MYNVDFDWARPSNRYKRPFDLTVLALVAILLVPVWLPLFLLVAVAIRIEDGGPILHVQRRVGCCGKEFDMVKFRTMVEGAERFTGPVLAAHHDRRTTQVGLLLRRYHIDELPQVINVFRGEMSLVGPRPERPALVRRITRQIPAFQRRLSVAPGIAGLAQARAGYRTSPRVKIRYDCVYIANMGPWTDLKLLAACIRKALGGHTPRNAVRAASVTDSPWERRRAANSLGDPTVASGEAEGGPFDRRGWAANPTID